MRTLWIAACPFACHGMSLLGEQLGERTVPTGLAASMLAIASLLLLPADMIAAWHAIRREPVGLTLRFWSGTTLCYAVFAAMVCGLMVAGPA